MRPSILVLGLFLASTTLAADRSAPPVPGAPRPLSIPAVAHHTLSSGLPVHLVSSREVPVAEVVLVVRAGALADPVGRDGVASMTAAMLDEGAAGKNALSLADEIDYLGAEISAASTWDASTVRLRVPVARLEAGLALLADVALRPDFPAAELGRLRKEALTEELQARDQPGAIGLRALQREVFGQGHRYGRPAAGDASALAALSVSDLRAFHAGHYRPSRSALVVVGDVDASVLPALEKAFGGWAAGAALPLAEVSSPVQLGSLKLILVDKPGAVQSSFRLGSVGPSRLAPGLHAAAVMNTLLGGSFTSRLNDNLREQHGYTYGARSRIQRHRVGGLFFVMTDVDSKVTGPAMAEVMKELRRIREVPPAEDLVRARNYLALGYAGDFESTEDLAARIVDQVVFDLPADFYSSFVPKALAVDGGALSEAAQSIVDPDRMAIVVVGDSKTVEQPLAALGLGKPVVLSVEAVMGKPPKVE